MTKLQEKLTIWIFPLSKQWAIKHEGNAEENDRNRITGITAVEGAPGSKDKRSDPVPNIFSNFVTVNTQVTLANS